MYYVFTRFTGKFLFNLFFNSLNARQFLKIGVRVRGPWRPPCLPQKCLNCSKSLSGSEKYQVIKNSSAIDTNQPMQYLFSHSRKQKFKNF